MSEQLSRNGEHPDTIVADLQELRIRSGAVSYAEMVRRITRQREASGVPPAAASPARSTVYNAFQLGRSRLDAELIGEIVMALGASPAEAAEWSVRCASARRAPASQHSATPGAQLPETSLPLLSHPTQFRRVRSPWWIFALITGCTGINLLGHSVVVWLTLPLFLDMIGTAIAAILLGPWAGAFVAVLSQVLAVQFTVSGGDALPFALVNVAGALVWGFGMRRFRMGDSLLRLFWLCLVVALACTLVAVPVLALGFAGETGHSSDSLFQTLRGMGGQTLVALFCANLLTSVPDKLLGGFLALAAILALRRSWPTPMPHLPVIEHLHGARGAPIR